jgi:ParB family chromosome partitioning protein
VNDILHPKARQARAMARTGRDIQRLEEEVSEKLGTTVEIKSGKKGSGRLVVNYMSHEHLDELLRRLVG